MDVAEDSDGPSSSKRQRHNTCSREGVLEDTDQVGVSDNKLNNLVEREQEPIAETLPRDVSPSFTSSGFNRQPNNDFDEEWHEFLEETVESDEQETDEPNENHDDFDNSSEIAATLAERDRFHSVVGKTKPMYHWNSDKELMHREHNIINRIGWRGGHTSDQSFGERYYSSRQVTGQLTLLNTLMPRYGNSLNFNQDGDLLCVGTDRHVIVWDWANNRTRMIFRLEVKKKIMQIKFIDSAGCLDIVSASADGQVLRSVIHPSGGSPMSSVCLYTHNVCAADFAIVPNSRHEIISAGHDGVVKLFDLRTSDAGTTTVRCVRQDQTTVALYTIAHHPYAPEFCVGGDDVKLSVYDKRRLKIAIHEITPRNLKSKPDICSAVYNHNGTEILTCHRRAGNYLFDSRSYTEGDYLHYYDKHFCEINFFGPRSEYIVSADFKGIYFWDKNTEAIISENKCKKAESVACLKPHPWKPVLATAGLNEPGIHVWIPNGPIE
nr:DDB1- and CUL4-associated factor 8-like protein 2 [Drosophila takahashii]